MSYFKNFPIVDYGDIPLRNIILKAKIIKSVFDKFDVYYPYVLEDWERPDTIASDYYGDSKYSWVVYVANDIVDPYYGWLISYENFHPYLETKYNTNIDELRSTIKHYVYTGITPDDPSVVRKTWKMSIETYNLLDPVDRSGWTPVTIYDFEQEENEKKRTIRILDAAYLQKIDRELKRIFEQ